MLKQRVATPLFELTRLKMAKMSGKMNLDMTSIRLARDGNLDMRPRDRKQ